MRAAQVMKTSFATVRPETTVINAARLLLETNQRGLPVLSNDGELIGIVSESDLLHQDELDVRPPAIAWLDQVLGAKRNGPALERMRATRVGAIMTSNPHSVDEDTSIDEVIKIMDHRKIGQVLVTCGSELVGIISRFQLISALERSLSKNQDAAEDAR